MLIHASQKEGPPEASVHCRRRCSARQHSSLADGRPVDRNAIGAGPEAQEDQQASGASRRTHGNRQAKTHLIESFHTNDSRPLEHGKSDVPPCGLVDNYGGGGKPMTRILFEKAKNQT